MAMHLLYSNSMSMTLEKVPDGQWPPLQKTCSGVELKFMGRLGCIHRNKMMHIPKNIKNAIAVLSIHPHKISHKPRIHAGLRYTHTNTPNISNPHKFSNSTGRFSLPVEFYFFLRDAKKDFS